MASPLVLLASLALSSASWAAEDPSHPLWSIEDPVSRERRRVAAVVVTPGTAPSSAAPLARAAERAGWDARLVIARPVPADSHALAADLQATLETLSAASGPEDFAVVAHGFGATLVALAQPPAQRWVWLAPVLGIWPGSATRALAAAPLPQARDGLWTPTGWDTLPEAARLLVGPSEPPLTRVSLDWMQDLQRWLGGDLPPLPLVQDPIPTCIAVSLGDDLASVEAVVPVARQLPAYRLTRLGLSSFRRQDLSHGELLSHPIAMRWTRRALRRSARHCR